VIAGTDCGLAGRVGHPEIVWAKLEDLAAGALLASRALISRSLSPSMTWSRGYRYDISDISFEKILKPAI
jgi:hypothetical protein